MKLKDYQGYAISLNETTKLFEALKDGEIVANEDTYNSLTIRLDRLIKSEQKIAPIPVLKYDYYGRGGTGYISGKLTSFNNDEEYAWFVSDTGKREKLTKSDSVYKLTEANLAIVDRIEKLNQEKKVLKAKIEATKREFTDQIKIGEVKQ